MEVDNESAPTDIRKSLRVLWNRKWWIACAVGGAVVISLLLSSRAGDVYAARSRVAIGEPLTVATADFAVARVGQTPEREMATQLQIVLSAPVGERVGEKLGNSAGAIVAVDASPVGATDLIQITVESSSPAVAQAAANAYAESYVEFRLDQAGSALEERAEELKTLQQEASEDIAALDQEISDLNIEIATLEAQVAAAGGLDSTLVRPEIRARLATATSKRSSLTTQRDALARDLQTFRSRADQLDVASALQRGSGTEVVATAGLPRSPIRPTPLRDAALAAAVGLVLGLGLAFGREALDNRIVDADDVERVAPTLSVIASTPALRRRWARRQSTLPTLDAPRSAASEAFRALRTSVEYVAVAQDLSVLLVTSATGREGKTTVASNLAVSFSQSGYNVVLVDLDLRRPRLAEVFGGTQSPGVTDVLLGRVSLDDALVEVDVSGGRLRVLPAGTLPPNPAELLGSQRAAALVKHLRETADMVILDSPPILAVTDPLVAARLADGVLLIVRSNVTTEDQLAATVEQAGQASVTFIGAVLNGLKATSRSGYHYSYYRLDRPHDAGDANAAEWEAVVTGDPDGITDWQKTLGGDRAPASGASLNGGSGGADGNGGGHAESGWRRGRTRARGDT